MPALINQQVNLLQLRCNFLLLFQGRQFQLYFQQVGFCQAGDGHCLVEAFKIILAAEVVQIFRMEQLAISRQAEGCVHVPEFLLYEKGLVDISFPADYDRIFFAQIVVGMAHDPAAAVYGIFPLGILYLLLVPAVYYGKDFGKSSFHCSISFIFPRIWLLCLYTSPKLPESPLCSYPPIRLIFLQYLCYG